MGGKPVGAVESVLSVCLSGSLSIDAPIEKRGACVQKKGRDKNQPVTQCSIFCPNVVAAAAAAVQTVMSHVVD